MTREHLMARLLRALSGKTQEQMAQEIDVHPSLISQIELGQATPSPSTWRRWPAWQASRSGMAKIS